MRGSRRPPLSARGTARQRFAELYGRPDPAGEMAPFFRALTRGARAHDLGDDSLYLAEEVVRLASFLGERERQALAMALLASMIAARQGCTRLPLDGGASGYLGRIVGALIRESGLDLKVARATREVDALARSVTFDRLIGAAGDPRPLVVADGHLYQHRMLAAEQALVGRLRARLAAATEPPPPELAGAIDEVVRTAPFPLSDEQRAAVERAFAGSLTVISGGPGTGKTAIIMSILRTAARLGLTGDAVALAAPTGKAVNRMATSIARGLAAIDDPPEVDRELSAGGPEPRTIHRLLGYLPTTRRFRHHDNNPLRAELVIVDEASMIDLALMERLLAALPAGCRLVLLGDADQLPSVDAGAVLRDLVGAAPERTCRLTRSYRMDPSDPAGSAILSCARQVNAGEPPTPDGSAVVLVDTKSKIARVDAFLDRWYEDRIAGDDELTELSSQVYRADNGVIAADDANRVAAILARFDRCRLLTVTRRQPTGAEAINRRMHRRTLERSTATRAPDFYPGEPILMRSNDYDRGLFNGDQGVILRVADGGADEHQYRAVFPSVDGFRVFSLAALRSELELAYAMTVHKSQGSELDEIALILPTRDLPLLTRELLYTAITRARRSVTLVGSAPLLRIAANRSTERLSGVADALAP